MTMEMTLPAEIQGSPSKLEPMLIRLPPAMANQLRQLAQATRIRQSDYLREAVADLIAKYRHLAQVSGETSTSDAH
jgi:predicted DNA-binding protein